MGSSSSFFFAFLGFLVGSLLKILSIIPDAFLENSASLADLFLIFYKNSGLYPIDL